MTAQKDGHVTERTIDLVMSRLLTDEDFRQRFLRNPQAALWDLFAEAINMTVTAGAATDYEARLPKPSGLAAAEVP